MPPRRYDPAGLPGEPNYVSDPAREAALLGELRGKIDYLCENYRSETRIGLGHASYNASVVRLRKLATQSPFDLGAIEKLYPWLRRRINQRARELAAELNEPPSGPIDGRFIVQAAIEMAGVAKCIRGKTGRDILRRYVEALMALLQETTGKVIIASRDDEGGNYGPRLKGPMGALIRQTVDRLEPGVPDSEITYWLLQARKKFAGKPMRFDGFCPGYKLDQGVRTGAVRFVPHTGDGRLAEADELVS